VTGRFVDMLMAVESLQGCSSTRNARSIGPDSIAGRNRGKGLNENLAREILELIRWGAYVYTQDDVTRFARRHHRLDRGAAERAGRRRHSSSIPACTNRAPRPFSAGHSPMASSDQGVPCSPMLAATLRPPGTSKPSWCGIS